MKRKYDKTARRRVYVPKSCLFSAGMPVRNSKSGREGLVQYVDARYVYVVYNDNTDECFSHSAAKKLLGPDQMGLF